MKIKCKTRTLRRWLASLLCVALLFGTVSVFDAMPKAKAAVSYNGAVAAEWARNNWNKNTKGELCATFAYRSLVAGGLSMTYTNSCAKASNSVRTQLRNTGAFTEYVLQQSGSGVSKTVNAYSLANSGKVALGDIIMVYVPASDVCQHAYVVADIQSNGLIKVAAWNNSYYDQWTAYSNYENNGTAYQLVCFHYTGGNINPDYDELGCSTAYAGWYQETGSGGANVNSRHSKKWGDQVGVLAKGEYVYVSKATGTGSGNLGHIMYNGVERYIAMGLFTRVNDRTGDPVAALDTCVGKEGGISLTGWAFDWDSPYESLQIEVYLQGALAYRGVANVERSDVNKNVSGDIGNYHGFNLWIPADAGNYSYTVYAVNVGAGNDKIIDFGFLQVPAVDTTGPEISNVQVSNVTSTGYDVSCTVTDPSGVDRVQFPTWTDANGQDDLLSDWSTNQKASGTRNGDIWTFHVNIADHNNEGGTYCTDIHAYDKRGNASGWNAPRVYVDTEPPTLSNRTVYNVTSEGFDVSVVSTDNVGVDRVVVKAWTNDNDVVEGNATRNGDTYTYHVSISDHGNARGTYYVNMWTYDAAGNYRYFNSPREVVVPEPNPILTFDANGGTAEFTTKQAERGAAYGALPEAWMNGYVFDGWYTDAVGGDRVSSSTVYTAAGHTTLYAHWIPVAADAAQGWALQDGTLIITVQGAMQDYTSARETPWFSNRADIRKIVVQNGVTSIGDYAFYGCENVTSVTLPGTVTQIGKLAFYGCKGLTSLELPESVAVVKDYAFAKASGLKTITFHGSAPLFGAGIFADVNADARCPAGDSSWTDTVRQSYTGSIRWSGVSEAELAAQTSELQLDDPVLESLLADSCV